MKLRCKPGDLAICTGADGYGFAWAVADACLGKIVKVTHLRPPMNPNNCLTDLVWNLADPITVTVGNDNCIVCGIEDHCLTPIRDPGDDAKDEMLRPLPHEVPA